MLKQLDAFLTFIEYFHEHPSGPYTAAGIAADLSAMNGSTFAPARVWRWCDLLCDRGWLQRVPHSRGFYPTTKFDDWGRAHARRILGE